MSCCRWRTLRKQVSHVKTEMGRILKTDNEVCFCTCSHTHTQACAHELVHTSLCTHINEISQVEACAHIRIVVSNIVNVTFFKRSLIQAIKNDEVFGFIKCDIQSPDEMIERHLKNGFLFPPVISKQVIDDDMISPYMKEVITNRKKQPTVILE